MTKCTAQPLFMTDAGQATRYTLENASGMAVDITDFGGTILSIRVPDRDGNIADVVLGHDEYAPYQARAYFFGAAIGRCANRIAGGKFSLNGKAYQLACNEKGKTHLHGGDSGFDQKIWHTEVVSGVLAMTYTSPAGEEQYPGTLTATITYTLRDDNALEIHYQATTDADTLCNLTNHSYFNLAGHRSGDVLNQQLKIYAERFTESDADSIPTGRELPVVGTPMDFSEFHAIGERIHAPFDQLQNAAGYDHNYILHTNGGEPALCAEAYDPASGRYLQCLTNCPGVQLYTGNFIDDKFPGKNGGAYGQHAGFCLETQFAPDAIHHSNWPSPILRADESYDRTTVYRFGIK